MEKILEIKEWSGCLPNKLWGGNDGYQIVTDKQVITVAISNSQDCCENWGYLMSQDNLQDFIDAELLEVKVVDTALNSHVKDFLKEDYVSESSCMFVNFETSAGTLQFTAYNEHNGYYGHEAFVISNQIEYSTDL